MTRSVTLKHRSRDVAAAPPRAGAPAADEKRLGA